MSYQKRRAEALKTAPDEIWHILRRNGRFPEQWIEPALVELVDTRTTTALILELLPTLTEEQRLEVLLYAQKKGRGRGQKTDNLKFELCDFLIRQGVTDWAELAERVRLYSGESCEADSLRRTYDRKKKSGQK